MKQLPLKISIRLSYHRRNFVRHDGVRASFDEGRALLSGRGFRICFFHGPSRSGKSHLSVALAEELGEEGFRAELIEGADFGDWLERTNDGRGAEPNEIYFVDDAHHYLEAIKPGESGAFVNFVEHLRVRGAKLALTSSLDPRELPCDDHVRSRLIPGSGFFLDAPGEGDMGLLIDSLARQRGVLLSERKQAYLARRLRRDVRSIEAYLDRLMDLSEGSNARIRFPLLAGAVPEER